MASNRILWLVRARARVAALQSDSELRNFRTSDSASQHDHNARSGPTRTNRHWHSALSAATSPPPSGLLHSWPWLGPATQNARQLCPTGKNNLYIMQLLLTYQAHWWCSGQDSWLVCTRSWVQTWIYATFYFLKSLCNIARSMNERATYMVHTRTYNVQTCTFLVHRFKCTYGMHIPLWCVLLWYGMNCSCVMYVQLITNAMVQDSPILYRQGSNRDIHAKNG